MSRHVIVLASDAEREKAALYLRVAPPGTRIEFKGPKRTLPQNDRLFLMLTEVSRQLQWHGQKYRPEEWKDYFLHALRGEKWMPAEEGGMVPIGRSTSDLDKAEFGELMDLIECFCARHAVKLPWHEEAA